MHHHPPHSHSDDPQGHSHPHTHTVPAMQGTNRIFLLAVGLNVAFIAAEVCFGIFANSLALLADAGHNASDVLGLLMAWGALLLGRRKPAGRYTYGLQSVTIMAALANALLLLAAVGIIGWEALGRISHPEATQSGTVMLVAFIGVLLNALTAYILHGGNQSDLNIRGAYLHMVADAAISLGVVASGGIIMLTGWLWVDPATSMIISVLILVGTWRLLRDSVSLSLHAVPTHVDIEKVRNYLASQEGVGQVHDLHVWAMSTTSMALTTHLLMPGGHPGDAFLHRLSHELQERFGIDHSTVQIETNEDAGDCRQVSH